MKMFLYMLVFISIISAACCRSKDGEVTQALQDIVEKKDSAGKMTCRIVRSKKEHLPGYLKLLNSRDRNERLAAIMLLGDLGKNEKAQEALMKIVKEGNYAERCNAAGALRIKKAVPLLIKLLKDGHPSVRINVAQSLGGIGDKSAIGPLKEMLRDKDNFVRIAAATALYRLGDCSGLPIIREMLYADDIEVRQRARIAVSRIDSYRHSKESNYGEEIIEAIPEDQAKELINKLISKQGKASPPTVLPESCIPVPVPRAATPIMLGTRR